MTTAITAALTATGVTIGPLIGAVLLLGGGAALIESINEIANEPCPDKRDYLLGALIGGFAGGYSGARLGGRLGAALRARGGGGGSPCSFVEGTPVQTKDGPKPIEKVKPEDSVLARNEKTGAQSYHKVSQTFATPNDEIYNLELIQQDGKSDVLGVTGNHPFWLKGKGWTESDLLKAGDLVAGKDGTWLKVSKLTLRADKQTGYNLEVEQDHNYFVGLAGAWVHNNACRLWTITKEGTERVVKHDKFGKIFKSQSDGLWWAKDTAGHGGSEWKVFRENSKGLEWYRDADKFGDFIVGKHKGDVGRSIPWKDLSGSGF